MNIWDVKMVNFSQTLEYKSISFHGNSPNTGTVEPHWLQLAGASAKSLTHW